MQAAQLGGNGGPTGPRSVGVLWARRQQEAVDRTRAFEIRLQRAGNLEGRVHVALAAGVGQKLLQTAGDLRPGGSERLAVDRGELAVVLDHLPESGVVLAQPLDGLGQLGRAGAVGGPTARCGQCGVEGLFRRRIAGRALGGTRGQKFARG